MSRNSKMMLQILRKPSYLLSLFFAIVFFFTSASELLAQDKIEREQKVKSSEVPTAAKKWLKDAFESTKSPKWYLETNERGFSYEAKFKLEGRFYSAEFDSLGTIQDVEIEINLDELDEAIQGNLKEYLEKNYKSFKIEKIQIQYSGEPDDLEDLFDEDEEEGLQVRYEIEYVGTDLEGGTQYWEGLFDEMGSFVLKRKVITPPSENLIF